MPNSGAFRSLHCLIYKVLATAFSVAEHLLSYHTFSSLSSTFFDFFQNLFRTRLLVFGLARKLDYFTTLSRACQALFSTFSNLFSCRSLIFCLRLRAWLFYHAFSGLSSTFFLFLGNLFPWPRPPQLVADSLHTIPNSPSFVKCFFQKFLKLFYFLAKTFPPYRDIVIPGMIRYHI